MWAVLVYVEIRDEAAGRKQLEEQVVPMVKGSAGFVAGHWMSLPGGMGASIAVFDTEEHARAVAPEAGTEMGPAVIRNVQIGEVVASA
jgi:nitrous oxide reductase accessory protein NosL